MTGEDFDDVLLPLYEPLERRLLMIVRDPELARDLTQDAFASAWKAWSEFDRREPRAWLFRIGIRLAMNHFRRDRTWRRIREGIRGRPIHAPGVEVDLWQALGMLRPEERSALLLHTIDGYRYEEIALMLGISSGTVGSLISRARQRLRSRLDGENG